MPGHGGEEDVPHSSLQNTRSDNDKAPTVAWKTPMRHLGFRQASAPSACARATSCLRTARRQPLRVTHLAGNACALAHIGVEFGRGPALRRLTDGDSKEVKVQCSRFVVALDKSYEAVTLTYARASGYFPNFNC